MKEKNELQLSKDLNVITAEIQSYKQIAGQSIFEIGRRLKHVKENDLVHGEFMDWYESLGFTKDFVSKTIRIVKELPNFESSRNIGIETLNLIATLPEEEREKEHITSKGETKTVDEMTVRELQELKRKLREAEQREQRAIKSEEIAKRMLEEEQNKEPKVIEKEVIKEIDKTDYSLINKVKKEKNDLEMKLVDVEYQLEEMKNKYDGLDEFREELSRLEATKSNLLHSVNIAKITGEFSASVEEFIDTGLSKIMRVDIAEEINQNPSLSQAVKDDLDKVEMMLKECRLKLKGLNGYETIDVETV